MLKMTVLRLEFLTDIDQHVFIKTGIRGGVAVISNRYERVKTLCYQTTIRANQIVK